MSQDNRGLRSFAQDTLNAPAIPIGAYLRMFQEPTTGGVRLSGPLEPSVGISDTPTLFSGDFVTVALPTLSGTRKVVCASTCNPGDLLCPTTNGQFDTVGTSGLGTAGAQIGPAEFRAIEACATAGGVVEALPLLSKGTGLIFVATGDSSAKGTSSTAEQFFDINQVTLPANALKPGDVLKIKARVVCTATHSTDTFAAKLYLGAVAVAAPAAFDAATNDEILLDATIVVTDVGAAGHVKAFILSVSGTPGTATARELALASTAIDTTATALIRASITVSVSDAGNAAVLRDLIVELVRQ